MQRKVVWNRRETESNKVLSSELLPSHTKNKWIKQFKQNAYQMWCFHHQMLYNVVCVCVCILCVCNFNENNSNNHANKHFPNTFLTGSPLTMNINKMIESDRNKSHKPPRACKNQLNHY